MIDEPNTLLLSISIKQYSCTSHEALERYNNFLFPIEIKEDLIQKRFRTVLCSVMLVKESIVGLALSTPRQDSGIQLISFYILPSLRGKGLGSQLIHSITEIIKDKGPKTIHGNYKTFWPNNMAWEKLLLKANWKIKDTDLQYVVLDQLLKLENKNWASNFQLPPNAHVRSLNPANCNYLTDWIQQASWTHQIPIDVIPGKALKNTNKECSLLLTIDHDIAGWIIVHDLEGSVGQVSVLYIRRQYGKRYKDLALKLTAEAFRRNQTLTKVYFGFRKGNKYMERLIQHRFKDYSTLYHKRRCQKTLL